MELTAALRNSVIVWQGANSGENNSFPTSGPFVMSPAPIDAPQDPSEDRSAVVRVGPNRVWLGSCASVVWVACYRNKNPPGKGPSWLSSAYPLVILIPHESICSAEMFSTASLHHSADMGRFLRALQ